MSVSRVNEYACRPMTLRLTCAVPHADPCVEGSQGLYWALSGTPCRCACRTSGLGYRRKRRYVDIVGCWRKDYFLQHPFGIRQRPTLPGRLQPSTISVWRLNFCVRYGNRWNPPAIATGKRMTFLWDALGLSSSAGVSPVLAFTPWPPLPWADPFEPSAALETFSISARPETQRPIAS